MNTVESVYRNSQQFPKSELYGLTAQMRNAAVSIPSNIAEGHGRSSEKEFAHFVSIARGSAAELRTQIILAQRLSYIPPDVCDALLDQLDNVSKMLWGLRDSLRGA